METKPSPCPSRRKPRRWSAAQRIAQAARIRMQAPWRFATGPRTPEGRARASRNARRSGFHTLSHKTFRALLARQQRFVATIRARLRHADSAYISQQFAPSPLFKSAEGFNVIRLNQPSGETHRCFVPSPLPYLQEPYS